MPTKSTDGLILKLNIAITYCYNENGRFLKWETKRKESH